MKRLLLSAAMAAMAGPAWGQIYELPSAEDSEIIAIGQRIQSTNLSELTSAASIITEAEIKARGQIHVVDILRTLPGVSVNNSGPSSNLSQVRVRGNEANQVLIIVDGVEVNNPLTGEFDFGGLQAANIERVELLRGEQSALWGSDAIGGVINIITKTGETKEHFSASIEAGSFSTTQGDVSATIPVGTAALSLNWNVFDSDNIDTSDTDGEKDASYNQGLSVGLNNVSFKGITFGAKASFNELDSSFDAQANGVLVDTTADRSDRSIESYRVNAGFEALGFEHLITASSNREENESIFTVVDFSFVTFVEDFIIDPNTGNPLTSLLDTLGERQNLNWAVKKSWDSHSVTLLAETEESSFEQLSRNENNVETSLENNLNSQSIAADYSYNAEALRFNASARQDFNNLFENAFTWKVGLGYNLDNLGLGNLRASVGTGVKNPTLIEVFGILSSNTFEGNPNLVPEKSFGFNVGYTHKFWNESISFSIDYFNSELKNEIFTEFNEFNITPSPDRANNRELDSSREGVEVELIANISDQFTFQGSATYLDAEFINSFPVETREAIRRPEFIASATASWRPIDKLQLTANIDHNGNQLDTNFGTFATDTLDSFTLVGARASYNINDFLTISTRVENLFDEEYEQVIGFASPGRALYGGLSLNF